MTKVSKPSIPVRQTKTVKLRRIFQVNNDDLQYLANPPQSEANPSIVGMNRSAEKLTQKQVNTWFKHQFYFLERLNKNENDVYDRFLRIEKEKAEVTRAANLTDSEKLKLDLVASSDEEDNQHNRDISHKTTGVEENHGKETEAEKTEDADSAKKKVCIVHLPDIHAGKQKVTPSKTEPVVSKSLPDFQNPENLSKHSGSPISRHSFFASKAPGFVTKNGPATARPWDHMNQKRSSIAVRQQKILDQPIVPWIRTKSGRIDKSEGAYKRRSFPTPRDPVAEKEKKKKMILRERERTMTQVKKYNALCDNLIELEKWDPMVEIRARAPKPEEKKADDRWKSMGSLGVWMQAYKYQDDLIRSLDPNSEEAMEYCRYLRKNGEAIPEDLQHIDLAETLKKEEPEVPDPKPMTAPAEEVQPKKRSRRRKGNQEGLARERSLDSLIRQRDRSDSIQIYKKVADMIKNRMVAIKEDPGTGEQQIKVQTKTETKLPQIK